MASEHSERSNFVALGTRAMRPPRALASPRGDGKGHSPRDRPGGYAALRRRTELSSKGSHSCENTFHAFVEPRRDLVGGEIFPRHGEISPRKRPSVPGFVKVFPS